MPLGCLGTKLGGCQKAMLGSSAFATADLTSGYGESSSASMM